MGTTPMTYIVMVMPVSVLTVGRVLLLKFILNFRKLDIKLRILSILILLSIFSIYLSLIIIEGIIIES